MCPPVLHFDMSRFPQRKVIRLQHFDYSQDNLYFITICVNHKLCLFGNVIEGEMKLSSAGKMVQRWYLELENKFSSVKCLEYVIMPNHIHFVIQLIDNKEGFSIFGIVQWFKTMTTNEYIQNVKLNGWHHFSSKLWQRSYYEHIIRNEKSYYQIVEYMQNNPATWLSDTLFENHKS